MNIKSTAVADEFLPLDDQISTQEQEELNKYIEAVNDIIKADRGFAISNGSPLHARFILTRIFERAQSDIAVFSNNLIRMVSDPSNQRRRRMWAHEQLVEAAQGFLRQQGTKLTVLLDGPLDASQSEEGTDHQLLKRIFEDIRRRGTIELIVVGPNPPSVISGVNRFVSADSNIYRFETTNTGLKAEASFNSPTTAAILRRNFNVLVRKAMTFPSTFHHLSSAAENFSIPAEYITNLAPTVSIAG